jgi:hypothetical protein
VTPSLPTSSPTWYERPYRHVIHECGRLVSAASYCLRKQCRGAPHLRFSTLLQQRLRLPRHKMVSLTLACHACQRPRSNQVCSDCTWAASAHQRIALADNLPPDSLMSDYEKAYG